MDLNNLTHVLQPRAKRLSLRVDHRAGIIRLTIPPRASQFDINRFVTQNQNWINEKQKTLMPKVGIEQGAIIPFMGEDYKVKIENHQKRTTYILQYDDIIVIKTSRNDPTTNLKRWMIDQARIVIEPMSHQKAAIIDKKIKGIDLRDTSSRWGSCSSDKRLMFSWRLIMAPDYVLDYVVGHEVAHLKRMDHSKKFWDVCYDLSERPDDARHWLKHHGNGLMRYF